MFSLTVENWNVRTRIQKYRTFMTSKTLGSSGVMNGISPDTRSAPTNTLDNGEIPQYTSLDERGQLYITSQGHELYAAACPDLFTSSILFDANLRYANTRFWLPKIVLKIIVSEIVRDRITIFLLDGSLDACAILACRGITEK